MILSLLLSVLSFGGRIDTVFTYGRYKKLYKDTSYADQNIYDDSLYNKFFKEWVKYNSMNSISEVPKKVIVPLAGIGTRLLPSTKAIPKEMLPILDKPMIQYVVEEIACAEFEEIIFVTHSSKNSIENHFDESFDLLGSLNKTKKKHLKDLSSISNIDVKIISIRQKEPKGLGHAVLCAKPLIKNEPFAVVLPDRFFNPKEKGKNLKNMKNLFIKNHNTLLLLE